MPQPLGLSAKGRGGHCATSRIPPPLASPAKGPGRHPYNTATLLPSAYTTKGRSELPPVAEAPSPLTSSAKGRSGHPAIAVVLPPLTSPAKGRTRPSPIARRPPLLTSSVKCLRAGWWSSDAARSPPDLLVIDHKQEGRVGATQSLSAVNGPSPVHGGGSCEGGRKAAQRMVPRARKRGGHFLPLPPAAAAAKRVRSLSPSS